MNDDFDRNKSLQELEGKDWGEPTFSSSLVITCHQLRRKPLKDFSAADLRIMIGQNIGLQYLMPIAIEILTENPLVEADYYHGDLLKNVLTVESDFWQQRADLWQAVAAILATVENIRETLVQEIVPASAKFWQAAADK